MTEQETQQPAQSQEQQQEANEGESVPQQEEQQQQQHQREQKNQYQHRSHVYACLRILVLHDAHSNAKETYEMLKELDERLYEKHLIELVFINSPLVVLGSSDNSTGGDAAKNSAETRRRVWWEKAPGDDQQHLGLDASLLHVRQIWKSMPFCGILAFGQGAALASLLPMLLPDLEFGIFCHGNALLEENEPMMANWPCLHVVRESDVTEESVQRLVTQLPGQIHPSGDDLRKRDFNAIGKFLVQQKKHLRVNGGGEEIVLQTQLHMVEHEAARVMAEHIAEDPPKALMAVISPQSVGGWSGGRRRAFGAEGGGAPCPSEFLLKRNKREDENGVSRHHPSHRPKQTEESHEEEEDDDPPQATTPLSPPAQIESEET